ncbi:MAG: hypothetical protein QOK33_3210 [Mycobacterium sp.]|jgi:hypothetical protein|nr:hypothetical protein [Mycobacterium sp.]
MRVGTCLKALSAGAICLSLVGAPTASAETFTLDNGLTVDTGTEGADGSRRIFVTAEGDGDDFINVRSTGHDQFERDFEKRVASFIVNKEQTEVSIQPCASTGIYGSACGAFSSFHPYADPKPTPKAKPAPPAQEPNKLDKFIAVDCPQPFAETCPTKRSVTVTTTGGLFWEFHATDTKACGPITMHTFLDGTPYGEAVVQPGGSDGGYFEDVSAGTHTISVMGDAVGSRGGCNKGIVSGWAGNLHVETGEEARNGAG